MESIASVGSQKNNDWTDIIIMRKIHYEAWKDYQTWRKNRILRLSGARPPIWVVETKAYPCVGLKCEFLLSILNVYFKDESNPWPSCLLIDLDAVCDGSDKVRHERLYTKSWFLLETKPREKPNVRSLKEENFSQSWDSRNTLAVMGASPLNLGKYTPELTSAMWSPPYAKEASQISP